MNKLILISVLLFVGCGGGSEVKPVATVEPVTINSLSIQSNSEYASIGGASVDDEAIITRAVFSQRERDRVSGCVSCFNLLDSIILGGDKDCIDCVELSKFLDFYHRDHAIKIFIVIDDELTLGFLEGILSQSGYSDIVIVSAKEELLINSIYGYSLALIGESNNNNIDWYITDNSDCYAKCINPNGVGDGIFDGVIYP